jgi:hypothetical protein
LAVFAEKSDLLHKWVSAVRTPSFRTSAGGALLCAWQMRRRGASESRNTARAV